MEEEDEESDDEEEEDSDHDETTNGSFLISKHWKCFITYFSSHSFLS